MFIVIYNNTVHVSNLLVYILLFHFTVLGPVLFNIYRYTLHISTIPLLFNVTDITF